MPDNVLLGISWGELLASLAGIQCSHVTEPLQVRAEAENVAKGLGIHVAPVEVHARHMAESELQIAAMAGSTGR